MAAPVKLEILAYAPTTFFHCQHCEAVFDEVGVGRGIHREQVEQGLPPELLQEYARVSDWVQRIAARTGDRVAFDLVDVASVRGFWKSLRHRVRSYPAVLVNGRMAASLDAAEAAIDASLASAGA